MSTKPTIYAADVVPAFHATTSNKKLGRMFSVAYVPGKDIITFKDGRPVSDVVGTCGAVDCSACAMRGVCYAFRPFIQYPSRTKNLVANTLQLRSDIDGHFRDIENAARKFKAATIRYTESGEIETYDQLLHVVQLAKNMPGTKVYMYTKAYDFMRRYFREYGELPVNMTVLISIWGSIGVAEYMEFRGHRGIKAFVVLNDDIQPDAACPAYYKDAAGTVKRRDVDCNRCGLCAGRVDNVNVIRCEYHK